MKRNDWGMLSAIVVCFVGIGLLSCTDDTYDMGDGLDMDVKLGGDSLYIPLGSTEEFTLRKLLGDSSEIASLLTVNEAGVYVLSPDLQGTRIEADAIDAAFLRVDDVESTADFTLPASGGAAPVTGTLGMDFRFSNLPQEVIALDELIFRDQATYVEFRIQFPDAGSDLNGIRPDLDVTLPSAFAFRQGEGPVGNRFRITELDSDGEYVRTWPLASLQMENARIEQGNLSFTAAVEIDGSVSTENISSSVRMEVMCAIRQIDPWQARGVFNPSVKSVRLEADFGMVPKVFRANETRLDFEDPYLLLTLENGTGLGLNAEVDMVPVFDNVERTDLKETVSLFVPPLSGTGSEGQRYWLGMTSRNVLPGCEFVRANVPAMLRHLPDMLRVDVRSAIDMSGGSYVYTFDGKPTYVNSTIEPEVPLVFGDDFYVAFSDTVDGLPFGLSAYMVDGELLLYGEIHNTYPMAFTIELSALDEEGNLLPLRTEGKQEVAGSQGGEEAVSNLEFRFRDPDRVLDEDTYIAAFLVDCEAFTDSQIGGGGIKESSFFRLDLKLHKTGGIVVDMRQESK